MNKQQIMRNAWAIYRSRYPQPSPFNRVQFGYALSRAWRDAREVLVAAQRAANPPTVRDVIERKLVLLTYRPDYRRAQMERADLTAMLAQL